MNVLQSTKDKLYYICIFIRIIFGIIIFNGLLDNYVSTIIIITLCISFIFLYKFLTVKHIYKVYFRTSIIYGLISFLYIKNIENKKIISGILIIIDALMGFQSKYNITFNIFFK